MAKTTERAPYEELARGFEQNHVFAHMHSYDLYGKWLEAAWAFLNIPIDAHTFRERLDKYTCEQGAEFGRLICVYTDAVEDMPFQDILGQIFMRLDVNSVRAGQYFTPWPIAEMMARMQFSKEDFERQAAEKGEVSVCDPAVGSGVMLLAFAKVVNDELGRAAVNKLRLYGTDIDERCVLMCRIQLRINGLDSVGRTVGLLGSLLPENAPVNALPAESPALPSPASIDTTTPPDLSKAVILHAEEKLNQEREPVEQLTLF